MKIFTPPWSNETVGPGMRAVAWCLVVLFGIGFAFFAYYAMSRNVSGAPVVSLLGCAYLSLVFLYTARKGKAPSRWLPW
jgi:hypothetical protein